jgi:hypothetical protein
MEWKIGVSGQRAVLSGQLATTVERSLKEGLGGGVFVVYFHAAKGGVLGRIEAKPKNRKLEKPFIFNHFLGKKNGGEGGI